MAKGLRLKYVGRAGKKGDAAQDVMKAMWFLRELYLESIGRYSVRRLNVEKEMEDFMNSDGTGLEDAERALDRWEKESKEG